MSSAVADATTDAAPKKKGSKKLLIIIVAVVLLLVVGGGAAVFMMKKKAAEAAAAAEAEGDGEEAKHPVAKKHDDHKAAPTFVPLDVFTVNLADKEAERFAQVGVTFEIEDAHAADQVKAYLPSIRNGILMILAHKSSAELLERAGKEKLAQEIGRETARAMGYEVEEEEADAAADDEAAADDKPKKSAKKKKKKKAPVEVGPVKRVIFSSFIIQ